MSDDSLTAPKRKDGFEHESPIRAFTDFKVEGTYAIGKGFRPSLAHLTAYLNAMEAKEGWTMVQIILPDDDASDPTIIFRRDTPAIDAAKLGLPVETLTEIVRPGGRPTFTPAESITPTHYSGRACADIGERLSANGFQILRYVWRLGQKDDPCIEIGKAIWYATSEVDLLTAMPTDYIVSPNVFGIGDANGFLEDRICDESTFTQNIARMLWSPYGVTRMGAIKATLSEHQFHLDCGRGLAV